MQPKIYTVFKMDERAHRDGCNTHFTNNLPKCICSEIDDKKKKEETSYNEYLDTYWYKKLVEKHNLADFGLWNVYGEDPNCEMGGPFLGTYEGPLISVIKKAVLLPRFWNWGAGGIIVKVEVISV